MKLYQVALKEIMRRKIRVMYTSLGVIIGVTTIVAILTIALAGQIKINDELNKYGPNLMVTPAISDISMSLGGLSMGTLAVGENYIQDNVLPKVRQITDDLIRKGFKDKGIPFEDVGNIATIAPRLYTNADINGKKVIVVGIDPAEERKLRIWWNIAQGKYIEKEDEALLGTHAFGALKLNVGDTLLIGKKELTVIGVLEETASIDDYQIFMPLKTAQVAFGKEGSISTIDIRALCNACPVEDVARGINNEVAGVRAVAVKQIASAEMGMMEKTNNFLLVLAGITMIVGCLGVINTMMTSIHERVREIGIMKASGASQGQLIQVFLFEAIAIGVIGGIIGYIVGTIAAYIIGPLIFKGIVIRFVLEYLPISLVLAILASIFASIYPSFRASRIKIADAFRTL